MKQSELEVILQEGESYKVEFKEAVDKSLVEEACAMRWSVYVRWAAYSSVEG